MKRSILAAIAAAFLGTGAQAADVGSGIVPLAAPVSNWTGFYVGANVGYAHGQSTHYRDNYNFGQEFSWTTRGLVAGVQAGYNWQFNRALFGVEVDLGYMGINGRAQFPAYIGVRGPTDSVGSTRTDFYGVLATRGGILATPDLLLYVKVGIAGVNVRQTFIDDDPTGLTLTAGTSRTQFRFGPALGAGFEYAVAPNWTVKAEYLYIHMGTTNWTATTSAPSQAAFQQSSDVHTVRFGFNYRFVTGGAVMARY